MSLPHVVTEKLTSKFSEPYNIGQCQTITVPYIHLSFPRCNLQSSTLSLPHVVTEKLTSKFSEPYNIGQCQTITVPYIHLSFPRCNLQSSTLSLPHVVTKKLTSKFSEPYNTGQYQIITVCCIHLSFPTCINFRQVPRVCPIWLLRNWLQSSVNHIIQVNVRLLQFAVFTCPSHSCKYKPNTMSQPHVVNEKMTKLQ